MKLTKMILQLTLRSTKGHLGYKLCNVICYNMSIQGFPTVHHMIRKPYVQAAWPYVDINSRCRYQSITQYLKRCLIKDDNNYMFRPIAAIIRFSSESMVVVLYMIGMIMSWWWDLNICGVCYMLLLRDMGGVICDVHYPVHPRTVHIRDNPSPPMPFDNSI
jgi:hypothetical protein